MESTTIIVVLGMVRSGTSAITRALKTINIDLGDNLMTATETWNPLGFWEDNDIYDINENILHTLDYTWHSLSLHPFNLDIFDSKLASYHKLAQSMLQNKLKNKAYFGFKDPRTARLLPFWQHQFFSLNIEDCYIISLRNPLATANSCKALVDIPIEKSLILWLLTLSSAIHYTKNKKRIIVSYELLLNDPFKQINRIKKILPVKLETNQKELEKYTFEFLKKELNRHHVTHKTFNSDPTIPQLCKAAYNLLLRVATDEISLDGECFTQSWNEITTNMMNLFPVYSYLDSLIQKNKHLENDITKINTSFSQLTQRSKLLEKYIQQLTLNGILKSPMKWAYKIVIKTYILIKNFKCFMLELK